MIKSIGEIIPAGSGWAARVTRYGSGRKLPAPRILIDAVTGQPFADRVAALGALRVWADDPRACRVLTRSDRIGGVAQAAQRASGNLTIAPSPELDHAGEHAAHRVRRARRIQPVVEKLLDGAPSQNVRRDPGAEAIAARVASGEVVVTRCPEFGRRSLSLRRRWSGRIVGGLVG